MSNPCGNIFIWMPQKTFDDKWASVHLMGYCHQAYVDQVMWYHMDSPGANELIHWGRVTHICVSKLTTIGSDNGLLPGRRQAIILTSAGILFAGSLGTNFCEISIAILTFSFKKIRFKVLSVKWPPFCLGLNVLNITSFLWCCGNYFLVRWTWRIMINCSPTESSSS